MNWVIWIMIVVSHHGGAATVGGYDTREICEAAQTIAKEQAKYYTYACIPVQYSEHFNG